MIKYHKTIWSEVMKTDKDATKRRIKMLLLIHKDNLSFSNRNEKIQAYVSGGNTLRYYVEGRIKIDNRATKHSFKLSGDTDINLRGSHYKKILYYLDSGKTNGTIPDETYEFYKNELNSFNSNIHTNWNTSLMPINGNLQSVKKQVCNERLDTFICLLDSYYNGTGNYLFNHVTGQNTELLHDYLSVFESVEKYCEIIYHFNNATLLERMIDSGRKPIDSTDRAIQYINLMCDFKGQKKEYLSKSGYFKGKQNISWNAREK